MVATHGVKSWSIRPSNTGSIKRLHPWNNKSALMDQGERGLFLRSVPMRTPLSAFGGRMLSTRTILEHETRTVGAPLRK